MLSTSLKEVTGFNCYSSPQPAMAECGKLYLVQEQTQPFAKGWEKVARLTRQAIAMADR